MLVCYGTEALGFHPPSERTEKSYVHIDAVRVIESQKQALTQQTTAHKIVMVLKEHFLLEPCKF
jgi:hypothetical protein